MFVASASALPLQLLRRAVGLRLDPLQLALLLAADPRGLALPFGPVLLGDPLALGDHAREHVLLHLVHVVEALEADVQDLDAEVAGPGLCGLQDLLSDGRPPFLDRLQHRRLLAGLDDRLVGRPVGAPDQLDQVVAGDRVARLAVEDVVEPRLRGALVAQPLQELQRIDDAPAGVGVHPDEPLVLGRHLVGAPVPLEEALVEEVRGLDERHLEVQARRLDRAADRVAELRDDDLLGLAHLVGGRRHEHQQEQEDDDLDRQARALHCPPPGFAAASPPRLFMRSAGTSGTTVADPLSTNTLPPSFVSTRCIVSRCSRRRVTSGARR